MSVPTSLLFYLLTLPFPYRRHTAREVAGYFQSLALLRTGLESYTFITPVESLSSIHLHSVVSSPFVLLVGPIGGRIVSFVAALVALWVVYTIGAHFSGMKVGLFAAAALFVQPLFLHHAHAYKPETMSILLTSGAVLATIYSVSRECENERKWFIGSNCLIILAISVHMWEAVILLPVVTLYLWHKEYVRAGITSGVGLGTVICVTLITELQPRAATNLASRFSDDPRHVILTDPSFYLARNFFDGATVVCGLFVIAISAYLLYRNGNEKWLVTGTWALSGYSVFIGVPTHWPVHGYTAWGFIAPVALFGALFFDEFFQWKSDVNPLSYQSVMILMTISMLIFASVFLITGERNGSTPPDPEQFAQYSDAGQEADRLLGGSNHLTVVAPGERTSYFKPSFSVAIVHSGVLPRGHLQPTNETWPRVVENVSDASNCDVVIYNQENDNMAVRRCDRIPT